MAASRLAIATPPPAYVLSRGIGWQVAFLNSSVFRLLFLIEENYTTFLGCFLLILILCRQ